MKLFLFMLCVAAQPPVFLRAPAPFMRRAVLPGMPGGYGPAVQVQGSYGPAVVQSYGPAVLQSYGPAVVQSYGPAVVQGAYGPAFGPAAAAVPTPAPAPASPPAPFDMWLQNRIVAEDRVNLNGNLPEYNLPLRTLLPELPASVTTPLNFVSTFGVEQQGEAAAIDERLTNREIQNYKRTHPNHTLTDQNKVDDLKLYADMDHSTKLRRAAQVIGTTFPGTGAHISSYFERQANEDALTMARNHVTDDKQAIAQSGPTKSNIMSLREDKEFARASRDRRTANNFDLLGSAFGNAHIFGPFFRAKASANDITANQRLQAQAQAAFTKDPSQVNGLKVQEANLLLRESKALHNEDRNEIADTSLAKASPLEILAGTLNHANDDRTIATLQKRADKVQRTIMRMDVASARQSAQQQATSSNNQVAQQLLALSSYGPAQAQQVTLASAGNPVAQQMLAFSTYGAPATVITTSN